MNKQDKSIDAKEATLRKLRARVMSNKSRAWFDVNLGYRERISIPLNLVAFRTKFKVVGKTLLVYDTPREERVSDAKLTIPDAISQLQKQFGPRTRLCDLPMLINQKGKLTVTGKLRPATETEKAEYTQARRRLDGFLLDKTLRTLTKERDRMYRNIEQHRKGLAVLMDKAEKLAVEADTLAQLQKECP